MRLKLRLRLRQAREKSEKLSKTLDDPYADLVLPQPLPLPPFPRFLLLPDIAKPQVKINFVKSQNILAELIMHTHTYTQTHGI